MDEPRPFEPADLLRLAFVSAPALSPDGRRVAFVRTTVDAKENRYRSSLWLAPADGSRPARRLTAGPRDGRPLFSPDGRYLAFTAERDEDGSRGGERPRGERRRKAGAQLWVLPLEGGEARPVTNLRSPVGSFAWSPDGRRIAFVSWAKPEGPECADEEEPEPEDEFERLFRKYNEGVRRIRHLPYRLDGFGYFDDRFAQVFVVDVEEALAAEDGRLPRPRQVTRGPFHHHAPAFSPDGRWLAVSAARGEDWESGRYSDIWVFPADGEGEPIKLTRSAGPAWAPAWSPDGSQIAYLGHARPRLAYSHHRLWTVRFTPDGSAEPRLLTQAFDRSFGDHSLTDCRLPGGEVRPAWAPDGSAIYCLASSEGTTQLYRVDAASGAVTPVTRGEHLLFDPDVRPDLGLAAAVAAHADHPGDVYVLHLHQADPDTGVAMRRLTQVNRDLLRRRIVSVPERFRFSAPGGPEVDGWVIRPVRFDPARRYPAVLQIHGGPMAQYTGTFFFEFQLLAARGIAVVYTNPRGSQGYGEELCAGIAGGWGEADFTDLMAGVDAALALHPWIDPDRLGVAGGSYGGYMTAWITGHTDRFRAAVVMRPVINWYSFFGTSDTGYRWDEIIGRGLPPWENPEDYLRQSPIAYAGRVRTPTLIEAQEQDYRCLIEQAEQWFTALRRQNVEVEFIRYPDEGHGMSRSGQPWHRVHRLQAVVEWFARHLLAGGAAEAPAPSAGEAARGGSP